jgi:hypothetical protein
MTLLSRSVTGLIVILLSCISVSAQLSISSSSLNFGIVFETAPDSLPLTIRNNANRTVTVTGLRFYNTYGAPAFSSRYQYMNIPAGDSVTIWIVFSPRHNIFHNSEMVILNDGLRGYPSVDLRGQGRFSKTYYASSEDLSEELLKDELKSIVTANYISLGYNTGRDSMFMIYDNKFINGEGASQNTIECIYTGREAVGYSDRSDCQNNYSFNTEHTFPQGYFSSLEPMKSDLHHLFPTDNLANNARGDNPFGVVSNPTWSSGGSEGTNSLFEPRDEQKGKSARALLYFVIRWQDYTNFVNPQESILRQWSRTFMPDAIEKKRNDDIFRIQRNRNPFIDYPQYLERISSICNNSVAPVITSVDQTQSSIIYGTVAPNTNTIFNYSIVNSGNTNLTISNISLSNPSVFSFVSGGNDTVIVPGDALQMRINCFTPVTDSVRAFLYYNSTGLGNVTVPIYVNDLVFTDIAEIDPDDVIVYPNPVSDVIHITGHFNSSMNVKIIDMTGRIVLFEMNPIEQSTISIDGIAKGCYLLQISSGNNIINKRITIQ